ncbi:hypothetical protein SAMN02910455_01733 [Acidaminococcus fermentans]|uniref:hypothetical protein n=1 Tax=Acidaminococcus fermentans TaxID=905 RepID=UPI0008E6237F|nr:hypothetical protein [Acidaminococcus fermentans]SFO71207.1 hypothetical protein SAMN02910455_01733 [Acidaminococcus fermentans]
MEKAMIDILSVKNDVANGCTYCIKYKDWTGGFCKLITLDNPEPARPEFDKALDAMAQDFCDLAQLVPMETDSGQDPMKRVRICTVAVNRGAKSVKWSFTAKIFNPYTCKYQSVSLTSVDQLTIPERIMDDIDRLYDEAKRYIRGERAQQVLKMEDERKVS